MWSTDTLETYGDATKRTEWPIRTNVAVKSVDAVDQWWEANMPAVGPNRSHSRLSRNILTKLATTLAQHTRCAPLTHPHSFALHAVPRSQVQANLVEEDSGEDSSSGCKWRTYHLETTAISGDKVSRSGR